jgi:hypothetical protein
MNKSIGAAVLLFLSIGTFLAQNSIVARGNPDLTQTAIDRLEYVYSHILDIKLDSAQQERFRHGVIAYWTSNDRDGIKSTQDNLKYYDSPEQLRELRETSQAAIVEGLRRDAAATGDVVSIVLVEAFDRAHPNMRATTRLQTFADLVGTWKYQDALGARVDPNGRVSGVSFTDSATIEINSSGEFALVKVHNHCSSGHCRLDGSEEFGSAVLANGKLILQTRKGSQLVEDGALGVKQRTAMQPHRETMAWSIRSNLNNNSRTLCLTGSDGESRCFDKQ